MENFKCSILDLKNDKKFILTVIVSIIVFVIAAILNKGGEIILLLNLPFNLISGVLRKLSLNSKSGNIIAIIFYIAICLIPMYFIIYKSIKENFKLKYLYNCILSIYLFFVLYLFINQNFILNNFVNKFYLNQLIYFNKRLQTINIVKSTLTLIFYFMLLICFVNKMFFNIESKNIDIYKVSKVAILFLIIICLYDIFFFNINTVVYKLNNLAIAIKINQIQDIEFIKFSIYMEFIFNSIQPVIFILLFINLMWISKNLNQSMYDNKNINILKDYIKISKIAIILSLSLTVIQNLFTLFAGRKLLIVENRFNFSVLIFLFVSIIAVLFSKILIKSIELYEENKLTI